MRKLALLIIILLWSAQAQATTLSGATSIYGNGSDGTFSAVNKINALTPTDSDWSKPIVKQYSSFTLPVGTAISPTALNKGIYIYVTGTATIAGNITQTNMCYPNHGYGAGGVITKTYNRGLVSPVTATAYWFNVRGGNGGNGGKANIYGYSGDGEAGNVIGGGFGGGGCSSAWKDVNESVVYFDRGENALLGNYGTGSDMNLSGGNAVINGRCTVDTGIGGNGSKKAGGAIWIIANRIEIASTAKFYVNASTAGTAGQACSEPGGNCQTWGAGGGGGSGGGYIALVYNSISDSGISYTTGIVTSSTPTFYTVGSEGGAGGTGDEGNGIAGGKGKNGHVYKIDIKNAVFDEYIQ